MFRKPLFWIVLCLVSFGSLLVTFHYFPKAFPVVTLKLKMDRRSALGEARTLDHRFAWSPQGFREVALFDEDTDVQNYVELEGGGKRAFAQLISGNMFSPYTWIVRHFKEQTTRETLISFTPQGTPYGFEVKIPEHEPGNNISADEARRKAEQIASEQWGIHFQEFTLAEQSQQKKTGGRIDHTFIYERPEKLGEARYRLRLVVSGDTVTELTHFMQIPEAFQRRFEHMRSTNNVIATGASISFIILYIFGGCIIGLFMLLRERWVLWHNAVFVGIAIAFLQFAAGINEWPLTWMSYDTALSYSGYLFQNIASMLAMFIKDAVLISLSLVVAESMTRKAFPEHVQFWRLWSRGSANTQSVAGLTVSGYLLAAVFSAYQVVLYLSMTKLFGWWTPSDTLFDPNILATYVPWFNSLALAVHAGVWEESLFRAVPIAGAALIGQRFGKRNYFIIGALIVEAIIFGSGHANYANEPAYARPVELILPAIGFGLIYIYFGLLPAMILHFTFDASWMSIPLFVASVRGIWLDRVIVIILCLIPLWVIMFSWVRFGLKKKPDDELYNRSWAPAEPQAPKVDVPVVVPHQTRIPSVWSFICAAGIGLMLWGGAGRFISDAPNLEMMRRSAVSTATRAFSVDSQFLSRTWHSVAFVSAEQELSDRFVWEKGGKAVYHALIDSGYVTAPSWHVRFVNFTGDVAQRVEEYDADIFDNGKIVNVSHRLPESRAGAALEKDAARTLVLETLKKKYSLDPENLQEISATDHERPNRRDWEFEFTDLSEKSLKEGQPRIAVEISGNEVTGISRYVFVPEKWERSERDRRAVLETFKNISALVTLIVYLGGIIGAIISWSGRKFSARLFYTFFIIVFVLSVVGYINTWQSEVARFSTGQPFANQALTLAGKFLLQALFLSSIIACIAGLTGQWGATPYNNLSVLRAVAYGLSWGVCVAGAVAIINRIFGFTTPLWPDFSSLSSSVPFVGDVLSPLTRYIKFSALGLILMTIVHNFSVQWSRKKIVCSLLTLLMGFVFIGDHQTTVGVWLASGLVFGLALLIGYMYIFRVQISLFPPAMAGFFVCNQIVQMRFNAYPGAALGIMISTVSIILFSLFWFTQLHRRGGTTG
ncbi:MAG: CPBP family intramembrane glutamic endopeptidase [Endomicrobiales bacterium]